MTLTRRDALAALLAAALTRPKPTAAGGAPFHPDLVRDKARALAARPYTPRPMVPEDWRALSYEDYRLRWFRTADALWSGTDRSYEVDFFLPGLYFPRPVRVNTVTDGMVRPVPFDLELFDKTDTAPDLSVDESLGYSGLRLRTEMATPGIKNEFCVFQGASYFRAIGTGLDYGLSARGLALGTGDPEGEEFPDFTEFWIEAPGPEQENIVVHALMDSPSVAGAYRFDIRPGPACVMEVSAQLHPRRDLTHLGIAPLTSMFLYDETDRTRFDDFRPAVHDSDGLMVWNGAGEVLWRPLANPRRLQVSSFVDNNPRGFGLMQRARMPGDFADLEARYHNRPGLWVEPRGDWGRGSVTLVEIPTAEEIFDNIVAYWRPASALQAGRPAELGYRLTWAARAPVETAMPRVLNTRMGAHPRGGRLVTVDFEPSALFDDGPGALVAEIRSQQAETSAGVLQRNPATGGLRLAFRFDPGAGRFAEIRAQLRKESQMASEVWLYRWTG